MLDGEELPGERAEAEVHLSGCAACALFAERSARVTRMARTDLIEPLPELTAPVRELIEARPAPRRVDWQTPLRVLLAGIGIGQLGLVTSELLASAGHGGSVTGMDGATLTHFSHESSAWNLALAVGFLCAAARPTRTRGVVPLVAAFVCGVVILSAVDLAAGMVGGSRLLSHGVAVLGLVALLGLARATARHPGGGPDAASGDGYESAIDSSDLAVAHGTHGSWRHDGDDLEPTARRHAA